MSTTLFNHQIVSNAEEALEFLGSVLKSPTEYSIIGKGLDGKILLWNEGARRIYGYESEEVVGRANSAILHTPEDIQAGKPREMLDAALRDGKWEGTIKRVRKNGQQFTARVVITPRHNATGRPIGFLLISKDISDEIRLAEQLKATQFYTRSLMESNIDALMITDPLGIITDVNQQMAALTGSTRDELIGSPLKDYFTDPQRVEEGIRLVLREGKVTNYELTARSRDGRLTVVSYNASIFRDAAGSLLGVFADARDITEQKQLSGLNQRILDRTAQLEASNRELDCRIDERTTELTGLNQRVLDRTAQLEASNRELEAFSYSVSHDLRAPLRAIDGFSRILLEEYAPQLPGEARRYLQMTRQNVQQMGQLVEDMLTYSRLGRQALQKRPVAPADLVCQALENLRAARADRHVDIQIGQLPICQGDPILLKQVFLNLLDNALKFTRGRDVARIEVGCEDGDRQPDGCIYFVKDNGVGFDMQYAYKLFGVFQRLHRAEDYEGTGVGLAIVQRIVHRHGGRVWASAQPDKGAAFYFTLEGGSFHE